MKIQIRAILVIILTNFIIILLSILAGMGYVRENIEKYIEADMMVVADIADRFISSEIDLLRYEADAAARDLATDQPTDWNKTLTELAQRYPKFIGMSVMSRSSGIITSVGKSPVSSDILKNQSIQRAFSGKTSFTSTVPTNHGVAFYLAVPIPGITESVLVLTLDGMYFSDLVSEYCIWKTGHIFIDDHEGYVIANIRSEWVRNRRNFIIQTQNDPQYKNIASIIKKLIAGGRGIDYYSVEGISRICAYRPISGSEEGWCLGIVAPLSESPVKNVDRGLLLVAAVSFLLNVVAAVIASKFIKKPFEELAALQKMAEASSQAKSNFLAHMSHEIRTPLNAVVGLSELMLSVEDISQETKSNLEKIYGAGSTILSIVNDILDISKIESGKFDLYPVQYDTPSIVNDTVTLNIMRKGEKPITFKLYVDENLPGILYGDDLRVKQIFNNLLSNAFKYTHSGTVEWSLSFERDNDSIWLVSRIQDSGIGMKPEDLPMLFSDYNQLDLKTNRKIEGTGLGLSITKRLVEMMDGTISVESEYGKGTIFNVRLRQTLVSDTPIGKEVAENLMGLRYTFSKRVRNTKLVHVDLSYAHVLVVDDIATNLDVVKGMMKPYGIKIDCADSGPQAIKMIQAENPRYSAVFMDHMMPGMNGIEATHIIREEIKTDYAQSVPIIALTANAVIGTEKMFLSRGFQDFISKPIDMIKLDSVLRRWVRDKKLEKISSLTDGELRNKNHDAGNKSSLLADVTINGVDMYKGLERFDHNEVVFIDILRSYVTNTALLLNKLRAYIATKRLEDYTVAIHGVKGASYGIFAQQTGKLAEALEIAAKAGDFETVKIEHPAFEKVAEELLNDIDEVLRKIDTVTNKPIAAKPDLILLQELREACRAFDMDRVDKAMTQLESFQYESGGKIVEWLREHVNKMTFEEIFNGNWPSE